MKDFKFIYVGYMMYEYFYLFGFIKNVCEEF